MIAPMILVGVGLLIFVMLRYALTGDCGCGARKRSIQEALA